MSTVAPEQTGFELDRFQWSGEDRLEVEGRWFGVRGRRFVRPVLTVQVAGRRRRLLALLEHKPWPAAEGAEWIAAFPWEGSHEDVGEAELEVGALTVDLPPPGGARSPGKRRMAETEASLATVAGAERRFGGEPKATAPPAPAAEPVLPAAGETRQQLERELASARAELGRLRARHEEEVRELRSKAREAEERLGTIESTAVADAQRAEALAGEADRLRAELGRVREGQGEELTRIGASETEARAELERERERAGAAADEAERLRAAAAEAERLQAERESAEGRLSELREANEAAQAEITKLRQAARRSAAEVERLRAASRRPGGRLPEPPPSRPADPDATVAFQAVPEAEEGEVAPPAHRRPEPERRPPSPAPTAPGPSVRRIPRDRPDSASAPDAQAPPAPATEAGRQMVQVPRMRPEPGAAATRLRGDEAIVPLEPRGLEIWGPRLVALTLVVLLLLALGLIVRGVL